MTLAHGPVLKLHQLARQHGQALSLAALIEARLDQLPLPAGGQTLARWRMLSEVASLDLSLAKLFEGHTDALAILAELGGPAVSSGQCWGTWCAEPPDARVSIERCVGGRVRLSGRKAWCSGAGEVSHALVSGWNEENRPWLAAVPLRQPGITVTRDGWPAVGMAASGSVDVLFEAADAVAVGEPGEYVSRPGFWHGGAGIAACWFGGASGIARALKSRCSPASDVHRITHLGAIEAALAGPGALLREAAQWIDAHPQEDARRVAMTARLAVEQAAQSVLDHAGRALGAGPLCRDAKLARAVADLPIYLRQSHAESDLEIIGRLSVASALPSTVRQPWTL